MDAIRIGEAQNRVAKVSGLLGAAESFSKGADSVVMDYAAVEKRVKIYPISSVGLRKSTTL